MDLEDVVRLAEEFEGKTAEEVVKWAIGKFYPRIGLANSLSAEDVVLVDMIVKVNPEVKIFTLDTGRLNEETYQVLDELRNKYKIKIGIHHPDAERVEKLVREKGAYSFMTSVDNRKECCNIRKIEPLRRALSELDAWITGLRREQSVTRADIKKIEIDKANGGIIKVNPLIDWSKEDVWNYIKENKVPYNKLHDKGYPSIGCEPCTKAVKEGEDIRAGRWWWENPETKECGLHPCTI